MNQSAIHKNLPLFTSIRKYNQKMSQKLKNQQLRSTEIKNIWAKFGESLDQRPDGSLPEVKRMQLYLQMISHINDIMANLKTMVGIKNKVNDNEGKTSVVRSLVYGLERPRDAPKSEIDLQEDIEDLEEKIREAEEEGSNLDTDINSIRVKTSNVEREVRRSLVGKTEEDLDSMIAKARSRIEELEEQL